MKLIREEAGETTKENIFEIVKDFNIRVDYRSVNSCDRKNSPNGINDRCLTPAASGARHLFGFGAVAKNSKMTDLASQSKHILIRLNSLENEMVKNLKNVFFIHKGDCKVFLLVRDNHGHKKIETDYSISSHDECRRAIEKIVGMGNILM